MEVKVSEKDVQAVKGYLNYILHLDEKKKKSMLNDFLRRHVQDVNFNPLVSEEAVKSLKKNNITSEVFEKITWPWKLPGHGVPEKIRPLFTDSAQRKTGSEKILHFEHNIPASQATEMLLGINLNSANVDKEIKNTLACCTLCLITVEEDAKLTKNGWTKKRPPDAYEKLGIKLMSRSEACSKL